MGDTPTDAAAKVVAAFAEAVPGFLARLIRIDKENAGVSGSRYPRYLRYVAESPDQIGRPCRRVAGAWIIEDRHPSTNGKLIAEACEAAGVKRMRLSDLDLVKAAQRSSRRGVAVTGAGNSIVS